MIKVFKYIIPLYLFLFVFVSKVDAISITISNPVISNDEVTIQVSVDGLDTINYLQGMFTKSTTTPSYFGYTQNNVGDWYKYVGSPETSEIQSTFFSFTPEDSVWSGQLRVKNDPADPDYVGPGDYVLRVRRYTGNSSSGPTGDPSNDLVVQLAYVIPTVAPTNTPTSTPTQTPTPTPTPTKTPSPVPTKSPTPKPTVTPSPKETVLGTLAPTSTPSPEVEVEEEKKSLVFPVILIVAGILILIPAVFFLIKNNVKKDN